MEELINDYLTPNITQIRHSILGIDDSYNNSWDIYAELTQNAVDAIRARGNPDGHIQLAVDCTTHSISITDNGSGINPSELPELLKPFGTNKKGQDLTVGEKGVGLKFVIFSSNEFLIRTGTTEGSAEASITDAKNWKESVTPNQLPLKLLRLDAPVEGTTVEIKGVDNETIFNLNYEQFVYVLRTRTALGSTKAIWEEDINISIKLRYKDKNSKESEGTIPFRYWLIADEIPASSKVDLITFENWLKEGDKTDQEKVTKLKDKIIFKKDEVVHSSQRRIRYFACFVPKRRVWNDLAISFGLATQDQLDSDEWLSDFGFCTLNSGIFLSVKGMPTGISIDHPTTGYAGYWANFFMLFEDPQLNFDIGRKSVHGRQAEIHRTYARQIFQEFLKYVTKYVSGDILIEPTEWNRDEIFAEIDKLIDLNIESVNFKKSPTEQEASVAAIFYICLGAGMITDLRPIVSGYKSRYDLYAQWGNKKIIIEFKAHLRNLASDFNDAKKMFDEIDALVCWEITDKDKQVMKNLGITVEELDPSIFETRNILPNATHVMTLSGFTSPIYVIDLKLMLAKIATESK